MTRPGRSVRLRAGQVLRISEDDYLYGVGELVLRLTKIADSAEGEWLRVRGVPVRWDGSEGAEREAMIRVSALPRH